MLFYDLLTASTIASNLAEPIEKLKGPHLTPKQLFARTWGWELRLQLRSEGWLLLFTKETKKGNSRIPVSCLSHYSYSVCKYRCMYCKSQQQSFPFFLSPTQGFDMFRGDKTLCDVVLIPGDSEETFLVHRVIMASSSDYFKAMFTGTSRCG